VKLVVLLPFVFYGIVRGALVLVHFKGLLEFSRESIRSWPFLCWEVLYKWL
jgi:hypothetical protein